MGVDETIHRNLMFFIRKRRITTPQLSALSGIPIGTLQKYVSKQRTPRTEMLSKLAAALTVEPGHFFMESPPSPKEQQPIGFVLSVVDPRVSDDLRKKAERTIRALNDEFVEALRRL